MALLVKLLIAILVAQTPPSVRLYIFDCGTLKSVIQTCCSSAESQRRTCPSRPISSCTHEERSFGRRESSWTISFNRLELPRLGQRPTRDCRASWRKSATSLPTSQLKKSPLYYE